MKERSFINILMIDDNPFGTKNLQDIIEDYAPEYIPNSGQIPSILIPFVLDDSEDDTLGGKEVSTFFRIYLLRHSMDVKKYLEYCRYLQDNEGLSYLLEKGVIPDITLFDYALTGHEKRHLGENKLPDSIEKWLIPYKIIEGDIDNDLKDLIDRIEKPSTGRNDDDDNEGAYCAGEVMSLFAELPIVSVATTRKTDHTVKNQEVALFEYLKSSQKNNSFLKKGKANLHWHIILPEALKLLRENLKNNIINGKIQLDFENINDLLLESNPETLLITYSKYGTRNYPIVGLFINYPKNERQGQINKWLNNILNSLIGEDKLEIYNNAVRIQNDLWETFKTDMFFERVELSEYILRENSTNALKELTNDEKKRFNNLKARLCETVGDELIIIDSICSNGDIYSLTKKDLKIRKLVILFTVTRLYERWLKFVTNSKNDDNEYFSVAKTQPNFEDLFLALYPFPKEPIVLPFHQVFFKPNDKYSSLDENSINKSKFKKVSLSNVKPYDNMTKNILDKVGLTGFNKNQLIPNDKTVSKIEKTLLRSFANKIGLQNKNLPEWLK